VLDATVIGFSPDFVEIHQRFIKKHRLKIELLSDPQQKTLEKFGALSKKSMHGKKYEG
jgi:peroxiredoxin Q/BCP